MIDWLIFKGKQFDWFAWISHSNLQNIVTAGVDQLVYKLILIKLYSACAKLNAAVKTASDACLLLAKYTLSDLVGERPSSLIINFEQVINPFLV